MAKDKSDTLALGAGDLTLYAIHETWKRIQSALTDGTLRTLDISGVEECDTSGVQLLLVTADALRASGAGGTIRGTSSAVSEAVRRCGFSDSILAEQQDLPPKE